MTPRRATPADAATLARLNAHVQAWHAEHYPEAFFPNPDPLALSPTAALTPSPAATPGQTP